MEDDANGHGPESLATQEIGTEPEPTPDDIELAQKFLAEANLAKVRNQNQAHKDALDSAEKAAPRSLAVLEAVGDDLLSRKQYRKAAELLKRALSIEPDNVRVERKLGLAVLAEDKASHYDAALLNETTTPAARANMATFLTILFPGLGQIVCGEQTKGLVIMITWAACMLIAIFIPNGAAALVRAVFGKGATFNPVVFIPIVVGVACHVGALFDSVAHAKSFKKINVDRPTPPSDLPFE